MWELAQIPYRIATAPHRSAPSHKRKRGRSVTVVAAPEPPAGFRLQQHTFDSRLSCLYQVQNTDPSSNGTRWEDLRQKSSFKNEHESVRVDDIVHVQAGEDTAVDGANAGPIEYWIAHILEIRALDGSHVYCRVWWLYQPEETKLGRQAYHGEGEVLASNHMDIVDAFAIHSSTTLKRVGRDAMQDLSLGYDDLVCRSAYDIGQARILGAPAKICTCQTPANPDWGPLTCNGADGCGEWMHRDCVVEDVKQRLTNGVDVSKGAPHVPAYADIIRNTINRLASMSPARHSSQLVKPANEHTKQKTAYEVSLRRSSKSTKPTAVLCATVVSEVVSSGNGPKHEPASTPREQFGIPVKCLFCGEHLLQQMHHAMLSPTMSEWDVAEESEGETTHEGGGEDVDG